MKILKHLKARRAATSPELIYGVAFTVIVIVVLLALLLLDAQAGDTTPQSTTITNAVPVVDSVTGSGSVRPGATDVTLTENSSTNKVYVWGQATDSNGCSELTTAANWESVVYRTDVTNGFSCTPDANNCIQMDEVANLTISGCSPPGDLNVLFDGFVDMEYYADATSTGADTHSATTWTAGIKAGDGTATSTETTDTFEVNDLRASEITAGSLAWGGLALGATSSENTLTFKNTGNSAIDINLSADGNLICDGSGSSDIPFGNTEYSTASFTYGAGTSMNTTPTNVNVSMAKQTSASAITSLIYFQLQIPASDVYGTCSNTVTGAATADV